MGKLAGTSWPERTEYPRLFPASVLTNVIHVWAVAYTQYKRGITEIRQKEKKGIKLIEINKILNWAIKSNNKIWGEIKINYFLNCIRRK